MPDVPPPESPEDISAFAEEASYDLNNYVTTISRRICQSLSRSYARARFEADRYKEYQDQLRNGFSRFIQGTRHLGIAVGEAHSKSLHQIKCALGVCKKESATPAPAPPTETTAALQEGASLAATAADGSQMISDNGIVEIPSGRKTADFWQPFDDLSNRDAVGRWHRAGALEPSGSEAASEVEWRRQAAAVPEDLSYSDGGAEGATPQEIAASGNSAGDTLASQEKAARISELDQRAFAERGGDGGSGAGDVRLGDAASGDADLWQQPLSAVEDEDDSADEDEDDEDDDHDDEEQVPTTSQPFRSEEERQEMALAAAE